MNGQKRKKENRGDRESMRMYNKSVLIDIVSLFPQQIADFLNYSIIKRATDQKKVEIKFHDLRKWAVNKRGSVDDTPYGGGLGMILRVEPVVNAIRAIKKERGIEGIGGIGKGSKTIMFDARGETYNQKIAFEFAKLEHLILICGHYEGFDERILNYVDMAVSIGDFVLTGGEIPALAVVDSVVRLLPGVLKPGVIEEESFAPAFAQGFGGQRGVLKEGVVEEESFSGDEKRGYRRDRRHRLEYSQYTRPEVFEGHKVPEVLLSGNHGEIEKWRKDRKPVKL